MWDEPTASVDSGISEAEYQTRREQESQCVVCMNNPREVAFIPCGHIVYCQACGQHIHGTQPNRCPTCRVPIQNLLRVYNS